ncbi:pyridoxamine 5'-phosphate oxidase family protein [Pseudooceanicola nitratireducens]|uniref:pyridoxamine 5'-phosphate oxidase family protein n=1 Tax=Pseudooceanicola nitratireducens TaxID=517719 RepID=UPI003C7B7C1B
MKDHVHNLKETFWDRAGDARAVLMEIDGRAVPMSPYADKDEGVIWFITAEGTDAQKAANGAGQVRLIYGDSGAKLYGTVEGSLTQADNSAKLDELWSPVAAAWFEDGREDDDVRLLAFRPTRGEVWATDGAAGFLYQIAKANMSDDTPDMGEHGSISF